MQGVGEPVVAYVPRKDERLRPEARVIGLEPA